MDLNKPEGAGMRFIIWFAVWWGLTFLFRFSPLSSLEKDKASTGFVLMMEWVIFFAFYYKFVK